MSAPQGVQGAKDAVLVKSESVASDIPVIKGYDFNAGINYDELIKKMLYTGYQASHLGKAVDIIDQMLAWRLSDVPQTAEEIADEQALPAEDRTDRANTKATIFLGYTSNLVSSGLRETIRYLCEHKLIDAIVSTAGGVEEDFIKCLAPTYLGEFSSRGVELRAKGLNRIGNLLVPNDNYCKFEDWLTPILDAMLAEQKEGKVSAWTPSTIINRLGKEINNEESIYYWCWKNDIPVFCPAITDGSLGDMMFFHSLNKPGLTVDILDDLRKVNNMAIQAWKTGMIILGSGIVKHHIANANLMRNGADFAVYVNTAQEFDGSDAGATPDEAVSWGKISAGAQSVKVCADATIVFPLMVAQTFAKHKALREAEAACRK